MTLTLRDLLARGPGALKRRIAAMPRRARVFAARHGDSHHCEACGARIGAFLPHREGLRTLSPFLRRAGYMTGDLVNHQCPVCLGDDRERHLLSYFDALRTWDLVPGHDLLHFAPESELRRRLLALQPARYVAADLEPSDEGTVAMDVTAIAEPDGAFDLVICNHVLEHVADVDRALSEVSRVLKDGGVAILQTPFATRLAHTFEDPMVDTDEDRLFFYGQEDHVRLFGLDLFEMMRRAGLDVRRVRHSDVLPHMDALREGVCPDEDLILASKAQGPRA